MFYRIDDYGNAVIFENDGSVATRINSNVYPVDSDLSTRYEHPGGIVLTVADAKKIGIMNEGDIPS